MYKKLRIKAGRVDLSARDPDERLGFTKKEAAAALQKNIQRLQELQYLLYAEGRRTLLVVLQAMDAGGKDGTIRRVFGPLNPQGCRVTSFKRPTEHELAHDFLWRIHATVPEKGLIGIFNRSHYEDVLIVRVRKLVPKDVWQKRYKQINDFESILTANGVHILKFFLHVSKDEQLARLKKRLNDPRKYWKANPQDFTERAVWKDYIRAYEDALSKCNRPKAPWFVIPADNKWVRNLAVWEIVLKYLENLDMKLPDATFDVSQIEVE